MRSVARARRARRLAARAGGARLRRAWAQELAGTPFEKVLTERRVEARLDPAEGGTRVVADDRAALARLVALRRPCCCGARPAASSTRRSTASRTCWCEARAGLLGLGRAGRGAVGVRARDRLPGRRARRRRRAWCRRRWRSRTCGCASRRSTRRRCDALVGERARARRTARRACCAAAASRISTCSPSAPATARPRPTRSSPRPITTRSSPCCSACAERGVAVVPFGGGTSVVGGLEPLRGAVRRGDLARPRADGRGRRRRRALAHRGGPAGPAAARGRSRAGGARSDPRATSRRATSGRASAAAWRRGRRASSRPSAGGSTTT